MRQSKRLSQEEFGRPMDYTKSAISKLEAGFGWDRPGRFLSRLEAAYGTEWRRWIEEGIKPMVVDKVDEVSQSREDSPPYRFPETMKIGRIESLKRERGEVNFLPVVSWASAGKAHDYQDMTAFIDEEVRSTVKDPHCFALRVEGNSMEPRYLAGDLLVLNPHREPRSGNHVVARLRENDGVLFKLYHCAGDEVTLTSYNSAYPPVKFSRKDFLWIYPVIELIRKEPL